jgi:uncharacterized protein (TIGR02145 family)
MKKLLSIIMFTLLLSGISIAQKMNIHTSNGTDAYNLADIDSITFEVSNDTTTGTVTDIDGNVYQTIKIGDQWWMAENLKVTHYRNGDAIPNVTDNSEWAGLSTGAYCAYNKDNGNISTYGLLYNWYSVDASRNIAPAGWHVPTDIEWQTLVDYLGGSSVAGGKLKETGTSHWNSPNTGATNESGFTALPGGYRNYSGAFHSMFNYASFWASTGNGSDNAWHRHLSYYHSDVSRSSYNKPYGFSIRLVRD